jgi:hypothetical protein
MSRRYSLALILMSMLDLIEATLVPEIFSPQADGLTMTELLAKAAVRILELGFLRGIVVCIIILSCLICLLIGVLRLLAAYLQRHDLQLWDIHEERAPGEGCEEKGHHWWSSRTSAERRPRSFRAQTETRITRYIQCGTPTPVTRINIHASPRRALTTLTGHQSQVQSMSTSTPLRSVLSKSPTSLKQISADSNVPLIPREANLSPPTSPSPKSVRWADEIKFQPSLTACKASKVAAAEAAHLYDDTEMDIAMQVTPKWIKDLSDQVPPVHPSRSISPCPSYELFLNSPSDPSNESVLDMAPVMEIEGDTS